MGSLGVLALESFPAAAALLLVLPAARALSASSLRVPQSPNEMVQRAAAAVKRAADDGVLRQTIKIPEF